MSQRIHRERQRPFRGKRVAAMGTLLYEFQFLRLLARKHPSQRQWLIRDDYCRMDPGVVEMSPSMQAAFMRVYNSKPVGYIRTFETSCLSLSTATRSSASPCCRKTQPTSSFLQGNRTR